MKTILKAMAFMDNKYRTGKHLLAFILIVIAGSSKSAGTTLTIGTSTATTGSATGTINTMPIYANSAFSYSQTLYRAGELTAAGATAGTPGYISSISYYITTNSGFTNSKDWVVYMGNTAKTSFDSAAGWLPQATMVKVFSGTINPVGTGWYTITFSRPFLWDGISNLAVGVDENTPGTNTNSYYRTTSAPSRCITTYNNSCNPDPLNLPVNTATYGGGSFTKQDNYADIQLNYTPAATCSGLSGLVAEASTLNTCPGVPVLLSASGTAMGSGLSYIWDTSASATGGWAVLGTGSATASGNLFWTPPAERTLYYRCRVTCAASGASSTSNILAITSASIKTVPYTEDFEGTTAGINVPCAAVAGSWSPSFTSCSVPFFDIKTGSCSGTYPSINNHTPGGTNYLYSGSSNGTFMSGAVGDQQYWYTPGIRLKAGKTYRFSYWYVNSGNNGASSKFGMYYNTTQSAAGAVAIRPDITDGNTTYKQLSGDLNVPADGVYYLAIKNNQTAYTVVGAALDDVSLIELPDCNTATLADIPSAGHAVASAANICSMSTPVTLGLAAAPAYGGLDYSWEYAKGAPTVFADAGLSAGSGVYNFTSSGIFYFRCKVSCPATGLISYSDTIRISVAPLTPPYTEDFESASPGINIPCAAVSGSFLAGASNYWDIKNVNPYSGGAGIRNHTPGGSQYLYAGYYFGPAAVSASPAYWITPGLLLTAGKAYKYSFWYSSSYADNTYNSPVLLGVRIGTAQTDAGMSYPADADTVVFPTLPATPTYDRLERSFTVAATGTYYVGIRYMNLNGASAGIALDDIGLVELPSCAAKPAAGKAVATALNICGGKTDTLSLQGTAWASDLGFQWQSSASGAAGSWTNVSTGTGGNTSVYITPTLTVSGPVYYRCVVTCSAVTGDNTDISEAVKIDVNAVVPPYTEDFENGRAGINMPCAGNTGSWTPGTVLNWDLKIAPFYNMSSPGITNHTPDGSKYLFAGSNLSAQYWFTPPLALTASKAYSFSFWYSNSANSLAFATLPTLLNVRFGTAQTAAAMTNTTGPDAVVYPNASTTPDYNQLQRNFIAPATGTYYVGIRISNTAGNLHGIAIDDISLTQLSSCTMRPVAGVAKAIPNVLCTPGKTVLSLSGVSVASDLTFQWWECDASGTLLTAIPGATLSTYTTDTISSVKYYRCVVTCPLATGINSDMSQLVKVNVTPIVPPYREDFEAATAGVNVPCAANSGTWSGTAGWYLFDAPNASISYPGIKNHTPDGSNYLFANYTLGNYNNGNVPRYWFTPAMALSKGKSYKFTAWYSGAGAVNTATNEPWGQLSFYAGTGQTEADMTLLLGDTIYYGGDPAYKSLSRSFTAPANGTYYIGIKVDNMGNMTPGIAIDDLSLEMNPDCSAQPVAGRAHATPNIICSSGTTVIRLSGVTAASGLNYQWQTAAVASGPWTNVSSGAGMTSAEYTTPTLSAAGPYYYRCVVACAAAGAADTSTATRVNVGFVTPPYREDFESATVCVNQPCAAAYSSGIGTSFQTYANNNALWAIKAGEVYPKYPGNTNHTPGGLKHLAAGSNLGTGFSATYGVNYWFTPAIRLTKDSTYEFSYWYALCGALSGTATPLSTIGMYYGTAQTAASMTTAIIPDQANQSNRTFKQLSGRLVAPSTGNYYFAVKVNHTNPVNYGMSIDDIKLEQLPPCDGKPVAGTISANPAYLCSPGAVSLGMDMTGTSRSSGLRYYWQYTETDPAVSFVPSGSYGSSAAPLTVSDYNISSLTATRWFRCVVKCMNTGDSVFSSVIKVDVGAITPPYIETFETGVPDNNQPCAAYTYSNGTVVYTARKGANWGTITFWNLWGMPSSSYNFVPLDNHTPGGSKYLSGGQNIGMGAGKQEFWFTPAIALAAGKEYELSYWYVTDGATASVSPDYNLAAFIGTAQAAAAMTIPLGPALSGLNNTNYQQVKYRFTPAASANYYIGFRKGQMASGWGLALDDISVQEVPPCFDPVAAGTVTASSGFVCYEGATTTLDLSGATLASGLIYDWQYKTASSNWISFSTVKPPVTSPPVREATAYRCIVICPASGKVDTSGTCNVSGAGRELPYYEDFESVADRPQCSDATYWGSLFYDGWKVYTGVPDISSISYANHTPGGKKYLIAGYYMGSNGFYSPITEDNYWFTPGFNLKAGYKYALSFWFQAAQSYGSTNRIGVYYGGDQNVSAMTHAILPFRPFSNIYYQQFDTTFVSASSGLCYLGFKVAPAILGTTSQYGVAFDDISLNYAPCDGSPAAGIVSGNISSGTKICSNTAARLANTGATITLVPGISYQWQRRSLGGGSPSVWTAIAGATDTVLSADTLAGYEYRFAVICRNTGDAAFSVAYQLPLAPAHPPVAILPATSPVTFCPGDTVRLDATSYSDGVYTWLLDNTEMPGWHFSDMGATEPGNYVVKVTSPRSVCPAYSAPVQLQLSDPGYKVTVSAPADSILCAGTAVVLTATGSKPGLQYQWRKDNTDIPGAVSTTYVVTASGNYRVFVSDGGSYCKAASRSMLFTVKPNPPAVISLPGGSLTACAEVGVPLQANVGAYSYQWYRGGSPVYGWVDSAVVATTPGTYYVRTRTADGCLSESVPVTINILPSPAPIIAISGASSTPLLSTTTAYLAYMWIRSGATTDTAYDATVAATKKGRYRVIVTDANGCTGVSMPVELTDPGLGIGTINISAADIRIFPNPSDAKVFIESPVPVRLEVKDMTGKTIMNQADAREVDMSHYADGVYIFLVRDQGGKQLIKEQRVSKITR